MTEDHSVVGVPINGWLFAEDETITTTTTTSTSRTSAATASITNTREIQAAAATTRVLPDEQIGSGESDPMSGGVIAGIVIGALAAVALLVGLLTWLFLRKRRKNAALVNNAAHLQAAAAHDEKKDASYPSSSADSNSLVSPLPVYHSSGHTRSQVELDSTPRPAEMAAAPQPVELHSTQYRYEMPA